MVEGVVAVPVQTVDDVHRSLSHNLVALPHGLRAVLVDHRHGVVVGRAVAHGPAAVLVLDGECGVEVVHGIEHRSRATAVVKVGHGHAHVLTIHGVETDREVDALLQHLRAHERAHVHAVHVCAFHDTLTVHVVHRSHVLGLVVSAVDAHVVVVAHAGAQHFVLPVGAAALVVGIVDAVGTHVVANVVGRCHIEGLCNIIESHVAVVAHVGALVLAALGGDDDHAVGSLRTVDGRCRSIAQHVDRLNVVGGYHRDVNAGNAVDDVVRLHSGTLTQRRGATQADAGRAVGVARTGHDQTGHLALQHGGGIREHTLVQVFSLHGSNR